MEMANRMTIGEFAKKKPKDISFCQKSASQFVEKDNGCMGRSSTIRRLTLKIYRQ